VNTGEVVVGDAVHGQEIVVGDAVNVAARLEQAAGPGEVLIGEQTWRLVRDAATVEPVAPLAVKGKANRWWPSGCSAYDRTSWGTLATWKRQWWAGAWSLACWTLPCEPPWPKAPAS
jgi:hypothetical protein